MAGRQAYQLDDLQSTLHNQNEEANQLATAIKRNQRIVENWCAKGAKVPSEDGQDIVNS